MPSSAVRTFTEPDAYFTGIRNLRIDGIVTNRGNFRARATRIDLHRLWMHRFEEKLPRIMRITPSGTRAVFLFATDRGQPTMRINGIDTTPDEVAISGLHWPYYLQSPAACEWATASLTPEDLAEAGEAIVGRPVAPPPLPHRTRPPAPVASRLAQLHAAASHLAATAPDILAKPEVAQAVEQALVEAMVLCLAEPYPDMRHVYRHRATVMRRLEEVLASEPEKPVYMPELCARLGASYTTLRDCCQDYLGMSPKRYLWLRRMHLARRALRSADGGTTTVTEIATNYGFWELGRFAVAYKSLFGEPPSAALRRPPEEKERDALMTPMWQFVKSA